MTELKEIKLRKFLEKNTIKTNKMVNGIIVSVNNYLIEDVDDFIFNIINFFEKTQNNE